MALIIVPQIPSEVSMETDISTIFQIIFSVPPFNMYSYIFLPFLAGTGILFSYGIAEEFKTSLIKALIFSLFATFLIILFFYVML